MDRCFNKEDTVSFFSAGCEFFYRLKIRDIKALNNNAAMNLSIPALQTLDRFTSVLMDAHGVMLGAKFVPTGEVQVTYNYIDVANHSDSMQRGWIPGGPVDHKLNVQMYIEAGKFWYVFSVMDREYCAQLDDLGDFIRDGTNWVIRSFTNTSVTFRAGDRYNNKAHDFTFNLNVD